MVTVSIVLDRAPQAVVVLVWTPQGLVESRRYEVPEGPLSAHDSDVLSLEVADAVYTALAKLKGVQTDLGLTTA
jgi:hypothetical protein